MCSSADGSVVPIDTSGVDARYSQANEYYRDDGQDDVAHASLLETSQHLQHERLSPVSTLGQVRPGSVFDLEKEDAQRDRQLHRRGMSEGGSMRRRDSSRNRNSRPTALTLPNRRACDAGEKADVRGGHHGDGNAQLAAIPEGVARLKPTRSALQDRPYERAGSAKGGLLKVSVAPKVGASSDRLVITR